MSYTIENGVLVKYSGKAKTLYIPDGVKTIGAYAFAHNKTLRDIKIPEGIETIEEFAFAFSHIESISFPNSLKEIGPHAFYECWDVKEVNFKEGLETIRAGAFQGCGGETPETVVNFMFPSSLKRIEEGAFCARYAQDELHLENVLYIGNSTFADWRGTKDFYLSPHAEIGESSFAGGEETKEFHGKEFSRLELQRIAT